MSYTEFHWLTRQKQGAMIDALWCWFFTYTVQVVLLKFWKTDVNTAVYIN